MGWQTVAFILNDLSNELEKSPKTVAFALAHPPLSESDKQHWEGMVRRFAQENNEPTLHFQALEVLPTFHADQTTFFRAGGNCIVALKLVKYGKTKEGKRTVTLELPDWDK